MRWIQYPTEKDRDHRARGRAREGQIWCDAPGVRRKWVVPSDLPRTFALVVVYENEDGERNYALGDWPGALL